MQQVTKKNHLEFTQVIIPGSEIFHHIRMFSDVVDIWDELIRTLFSFGASRGFKALNKFIQGCFSVFSRSGVDTSHR